MKRGPLAPVAVQLEDLTVWVMGRVARWPRQHRHTLGERFVGACLDANVLVVEACFSRRRQNLLLDASRRLTLMRVLARLARRVNVFSEKQLLYLQGESDHIGRQLMGWRRADAKRSGPSG